MNKKIILVTLIISFIFAIFIYLNYKKKEKVEIKNETLYLIQVGAFSKYDNVVKMSKTLPHYLVLEEEGLYHIYVAITKNKENLEKLKQYYINNGNNIYIREVKTSNIEFLEYIKNYDYFLKETEEKEVILSVNKTMLNKYEELIK